MFHPIKLILLLATMTLGFPALSEGAQSNVKIFTYDVVNTFPHDAKAFTQGLTYLEGFFYEGTGQNGASTLRKVEPTTGKVLKNYELPNKYFGEGITVFKDQIYQLTWKARKGFVYDLETFKLNKEFNYDSEGWGITHNGSELIMSDGTDKLRFLDPESLKVKSTLKVTYNGKPLHYLNELEFIKNKIVANVWTTEYLAQIDPKSGIVTSLIDLRGLMPPPTRFEERDVLNGIAYDPGKDRWFVTGKWWPKVFEIKLKERTKK
jgi:glutamine cyclotransferase